MNADCLKICQQLVIKRRFNEAINKYRQSLEENPENFVVHVHLGSLLNQLNRTDEAIMEYHRSIELKPNSAYCHYNLGLAYVKHGSLEEAEQCFRQAISIQPRFYQIYNNLGEVLLHKSMVDDAILSFKQAIELNFCSYKAHFNLGECFYFKQEWEISIAEYQISINIHPSFFRSNFGLGQALAQVDKAEEATGYYRRAIALEPEFFWSYLKLADVLKSMGETDEAITMYRRANQIDPEASAWSHYNLGLALYEQNQIDEAISCYRQAIRVDPDFFWPHLKLADALSSQGHNQEAITMYHRANQIDPEASAWSHYNLGLALYEQNQIDEAISCYRQAIRVDPDFFWPHLKLADALSSQGHNQEAIAMYHRAIELNPDVTPWAYYNLGDALNTEGKYEEAITCYHQALNIDPQLFQAYVRLGDTLDQLNQHTEATDMYKKAIDLSHQTTALPYYNLGNLLIKQNKIYEAIYYYYKGILTHNKHDDIYLQLGKILTKLGRYDEANEIYHQAVLNNSKDFKYDSGYYICDYLQEAKSLKYNSQDIPKNCVFITARFRTGSSYLYSLLDCLDNADVFYEPLNEDLLNWLPKNEEDSCKNKQLYNHTFGGKYFSEYQSLNLNQDLEKLHSITFSGIKLVMSSKDEFHQMKSYLNFIIDNPSKNYKVLQFNRIDFRLGWVKFHFPNAVIVNLRRNNRDIYASYIEMYKKNNQTNNYNPYENKIGYLFNLNSYINMFNDFCNYKLENIKINDYEKLYLINRLSNIWSDNFADLVIEYESLVQEPVTAITKIASMIPGLTLKLKKEIIPPYQNRINVWEMYHSESWFLECEQKCEEIIKNIL
ncbi:MULTISPECIES: tetratricopeptide repeat protein [Limnospira]|uniref:tetratricopeptide repeat protein n=1 Tax=Limnospira sp. Paracas R14 TaxID=2981108 RepID=UPI000291F828|nr:tetratricopeptide repeat protein [Limnospira sp. Paracas R14]